MEQKLRDYLSCCYKILDVPKERYEPIIDHVARIDLTETARRIIAETIRQVDAGYEAAMAGREAPEVAGSYELRRNTQQNKARGALRVILSAPRVLIGNKGRYRQIYFSASARKRSVTICARVQASCGRRLPSVPCITPAPQAHCIAGKA